MAKTNPKPALPHERRIIARPRLLDAMNAAQERVMLVVAPAGYGKTTLARQLLETTNADWAWVRATPASADVAFLASAVGAAVGAIVPSLAPRITARVTTLSNPDAEAQALAEIVTEELEETRGDFWLVFDDAHLIGGTSAVSLFMETLVRESSKRMIVLSRRRPSWLPARLAIYGEMVELHQVDLAFTTAEASELLQPTREPRDVDALVDLARGWPAVIGLASMKPAFSLPSERLPSALYDYVAEELYKEFDPKLRPDLLKLSAIPNLNPDLVTQILGARGSLALAAGLRHGFITSDPVGAYDIHPLARAFFETKLREDPVHTDAVRDITDVLIDGHLVDEAFETIRRFSLNDMLPRLFEGHRHLLKAGRLSTLELWVKYATDAGAQFPLLDLADAELERRRGRLAAGEALALQAARGLTEASEYASQAYAIAGECAFYNPRRLTESLDYHRRAEILAHTDEDVVRALWGQIIAAHEIKDEDEEPYAQRFLALRSGDPDFELRAAGIKTSIAVHTRGRVLDTAKEVERMTDVLPRASDPLARSFFLYRLAYVNLLSARYVRAARFAAQAEEEVEHARLQFARAHVLAVVAAAQLGLRHFARADAAIETAFEVAEELGDSFEILNTRALRAKLLLARDEPAAALRAMPLSLLDDALPSMVGEYLSLRALALAITGSRSDATSTAAVASDTTMEVQTRCYVALTYAVLDDPANDIGENSALQVAMATVDDTQAVDTLVTTLRAVPEIIPRLAKIGRTADVGAVLRASNDARLAARYDVELERAPQARSHLTRREREVLALMCEGLKNREIAGRLFVSEATVKLHVHRILAKTGARTRTEAVLLSQRDLLRED